MSGRRMPPQKRGKSKQDYETPPELLAAVERRFGRMHVDLAARADNAKAPMFITPEQNSLMVPWSRTWAAHRGWLNPEFSDIEPWAKKCAAEPGLKIFMLTPASVGANWFSEHVHRRAIVLALSPRITFVGAADPYPKDCILSCFGYGVSGFDVWRWKP